MASNWLSTLHARLAATDDPILIPPDAYRVSGQRDHTHRLLRNAANNGAITLTVGSSSCAIKGFAYGFARQLAASLASRTVWNVTGASCTYTKSGCWLCPVGPGQHVEVVPAANGHTGTDFSAVLMDSLVPQRTDLLLWEYVINDWTAAQANQLFETRALDMWLRHAVAINPHGSWLRSPMAAASQVLLAGVPTTEYDLEPDSVAAQRVHGSPRLRGV